MERPADDGELRAVVFALFGGDAAVTQRVLSAEGIGSEVCTTVDALIAAVARRPGVLVLAEEALVPSCVSALMAFLGRQESWSDLPIVISAVEGGGARAGFGVLGALGEVGNVTILERPVRVRAMVGAVASALRARKRQYATRDLLQSLAASEANLNVLVAKEATARAEAETLSRGKDEFLATVSHELRTPLNAILGWARRLSSGRLDAGTAERALGAIERNAMAQAELIEDLLDVSRIVSGKLTLVVEEVPLRKVIDAAVDTVRPALDAKEIRLSLDIDPTASIVMGDPTRLQQVVWNLLSNAAKFTSNRGHVALKLACVFGQAELTVTDDGQGIEREFLPQVFQRFRQEDGTTTRRHGGLGLGLSICRQLVELHGGTIEVKSEGPGHGSAFKVRLPLPPPTHGTRPAVAQGASVRVRDEEVVDSGNLTGLSVLVVDDDPDGRELLASVIRDAGAKTLEAASANEAIELVRAKRPSLVVSDIAMPGDDGYWLIRQIRSLGAAEGGRIPAVALTAYAGIGDRRKAVAAGFDLHLAKPMDPVQLVAALAALAGIAKELA